MQGHIEDAVVGAGYAGIAAVMAVETVFPPIPSELVLPLAGFQVANGTLAFLPALGASTLGAVLGALLLYAIARIGGRRAVLRLHPLLRITERDLDRADRWFDRRAVAHRPLRAARARASAASSPCPRGCRRCRSTPSSPRPRPARCCGTAPCSAPASCSVRSTTAWRATSAR